MYACMCVCKHVCMCTWAYVCLNVCIVYMDVSIAHSMTVANALLASPNWCKSSKRRTHCIQATVNRVPMEMISTGCPIADKYSSANKSFTQLPQSLTRIRSCFAQRLPNCEEIETIFWFQKRPKKRYRLYYLRPGKYWQQSSSAKSTDTSGHLSAKIFGLFNRRDEAFGAGCAWNRNWVAPNKHGSF